MQVSRPRVAVVGHVEWVQFARVSHLPRAGEVIHAHGAFEEPAGGGGVAAVQLAGQARELHSRNAPASGGLLEGAVRVDHLAGARDVGHARELHPLDVAHHRDPRPARLHGGSLTQSARRAADLRECPTWRATTCSTSFAGVVDNAPAGPGAGARRLDLSARGRRGDRARPRRAAALARGRIRTRSGARHLRARRADVARPRRTRRDRPAPLDAGRRVRPGARRGADRAGRLSAPQAS